jgi:excisionase family DNA binding protein
MLLVYAFMREQWNYEELSMSEEVMTAKQIADELKVHITRVYKWIQEGDLIATDLGTPTRHSYRIKRSDLNNFTERRRTGPKRQDDID